MRERGAGDLPSPAAALVDTHSAAAASHPHLDAIGLIRLLGGGLLLEVAIQLHGAMEHANDVDFALTRLKVHDPVVSPHQDARIATGLGPVALTRLRKLLQRA